MKLNTTNLSEVTIGTPILAAGTYFARLLKWEQKPNKQNSGMNLNLEFVLHDSELPLNGGGMVKNSGFHLFRTVSMVPTEKYDPNKVYKELSIAIGNPEDADLNTEDLIDKDLKIRLKYTPADGSYPEKNEISGFLPIKDADNFNPSF